jgi:hypothetical protein
MFIANIPFLLSYLNSGVYSQSEYRMAEGRGGIPIHRGDCLFLREDRVDLWAEKRLKNYHPWKSTEIAIC